MEATMQRPTMRARDVRSAFLAFFENKGHLIHPSAPLKSDDPGLLFNVAGMQQFKPYFQGRTPRFPGFEGVHRRVATAQKCMRAGGKDSDIENVGRTRRHHTFFEMLGNFSFGDYFKREAIHWAWEFLTSSEWLGLEPERLYVTIFTDDDEAYAIWADEVGIPQARISRWGEAENFWPANAIKDERSGPCGPCSEIFYDRGPAFGSPDETGPNTGSGDRFLEVWNLVFTQFDLVDGELRPLPQKNIDTGAGLERLAAVMAGTQDAYGTDLLMPIIERIVAATGLPYRDLESVGHRIIADHARSVSMCIADGILPANDGAGYVIKMLLRRAARQAYLLGVREPLLHSLVEGVSEAMGDAYPEVREAKDRIASVIRSEEEQFLRTLESGIARVKQLLDELQGTTLPGELAFDLWDTYGFPLDLTREIAAERGVEVDTRGFEAARQEARERSRAAQDRGALFASEDALAELAEKHGETRFVGYDTLETEAAVLAILKEGAFSESTREGERVQLVLNTTPFYAEGGGQIGDAGKLEWDAGCALVSTTTKAPGGLVLHHASVMRGELRVGERLSARVDPSRRETEKHHSATHLLHAALRSVLGTHVTQAGSLVAPDRLRFDFSHPQGLSSEELQAIETLVNRWVQADFAVDWEVASLQEARERGAMMLFGEKYGERVRMVTVGGTGAAVSVELCGGTHVRRTGEIGPFLIVAEEAVSAGVRRVEALCGMAALGYMRELRRIANEAAKRLGAKPEALLERAERLQIELKGAQREVQKLRDKLAAAQTSGGATSELKEAAGFIYSTAVLDSLDAAALRNAADSALQKSGADVVVLASGKQLVAKVSKSGQAKGAHAGNLIREVAARAGGGGGGRPDMAQAGVKDETKLAAALEAVAEILGSVRS
jgi:alanyl-tRNA synthetase